VLKVTILFGKTEETVIILIPGLALFLVYAPKLK
jgi:hypothetical protein